MEPLDNWQGFKAADDPEAFCGRVEIAVYNPRYQSVKYMPINVGSARFRRFAADHWVQMEPVTLMLSPEQCQALETACMEGIDAITCSAISEQSMAAQIAREG